MGPSRILSALGGLVAAPSKQIARKNETAGMGKGWHELETEGAKMRILALMFWKRLDLEGHDACLLAETEHGLSASVARPG